MRRHMGDTSISSYLRILITRNNKSLILLSIALSIIWMSRTACPVGEPDHYVWLSLRMSVCLQLCYFQLAYELSRWTQISCLSSRGSVLTHVIGRQLCVTASMYSMPVSVCMELCAHACRSMWVTDHICTYMYICVCVCCRSKVVRQCYSKVSKLWQPACDFLFITTLFIYLMEVEKGKMEKGTAINDWGQKEDGSDGENNKREDVNPPFPPVENLKCAMKLISCLDVAKRVGYSACMNLNRPHCLTRLLLKSHSTL